MRFANVPVGVANPDRLQGLLTIHPRYELETAETIRDFAAIAERIDWLNVRRFYRWAADCVVAEDSDHETILSVGRVV